MASKPHRNDPETYVITCYDALGRKKGLRTRTNMMSARAFALRWARRTRGSAAVHRCIFNTLLARPTRPADQQ